jgi:hypothetical protein
MRYIILRFLDTILTGGLIAGGSKGINTAIEAFYDASQRFTER